MRTFYIFIGACLLALVAGHSYVTSPTSRSNQAETTTGCRGPSCAGPCDRPRATITRAPIVAARGDSVTVKWPRNNHAGGFIRLSWAPTDQSDSHTAFDNGVQQISCHEIGGCSPDDASNPNGGDSGPSDGSSRACTTSIKIPAHLTDGKWTLQWAWFGGAFALGDYYSCVDYQISGGASGAAPAAVFKGGDFTYPGQQKCKYFNTDRLHRCVNEPCDNPVYALNKEQSGIPYLAASSSTPTPATQAPTPAPTQAPTPAPTKAPATQAPTPAPTKAPATQAPTKAPTQAPTKTPTGSSSNCAGLTKKSASTAAITSISTWSKTIQMSYEITVAESRLANWYLEIQLPSSAGTTDVAAIYNAGKVSCQGNQEIVVKPVASWAQNLSQGAKVTVELQITYTGSKMSESYIQQNTVATVYSA